MNNFGTPGYRGFPGPRWLGQVGSGSECESPIKEVVGAAEDWLMHV